MPAPKQTYRDALPEPQRGEFDRLIELFGTSPRPLLDTYTAGTPAPSRPRISDRSSERR